MNKKWMGASAALLLAGCASVEMSKYTVTSYAEVSLKKGAKINVVAKNEAMRPIVNLLSEKLSQENELGFTCDTTKPDYWFVIDGDSQYVPAGIVKTYEVSTTSNEFGGNEVIREVNKNASSYAKNVSVSVYATKGLTPVHYMVVPLYDGDLSDSAARGESIYDKVLAEDVVERLMDAFVTQKKEIETPIPLEADSNLRKLFAEGNYDGFCAERKKFGKVNLDEIFKSIEEGTYKGEKIEKVLGNYYLAMLVAESCTNEEKALRKIQSEHLKMLEHTRSKGLVEAIPVALARLEYKLAHTK